MWVTRLIHIRDVTHGLHVRFPFVTDSYEWVTHMILIRDVTHLIVIYSQHDSSNSHPRCDPFDSHSWLDVFDRCRRMRHHLIPIRGATHPCMWHDSYICDVILAYVTWLIHVRYDSVICDSYSWRVSRLLLDWFSFVTWLICYVFRCRRMRCCCESACAYSWVTHLSLVREWLTWVSFVADSYVWATHPIFIRDVTHSVLIRFSFVTVKVPEDEALLGALVLMSSGTCRERQVHVTWRDSCVGPIVGKLPYVVITKT